MIKSAEATSVRAVAARAGALVAGVVGLAVLASCGELAPGPVVDPVAAPAPPGVVQVLALDNRFIPEITSVPAGSRIVFVNRGRNEHNIIPSRGGSGWGIGEDEFVNGFRYEAAFNATGTAYYFCDIHGDAFSGMIGQINIE